MARTGQARKKNRSKAQTPKSSAEIETPGREAWRHHLDRALRLEWRVHRALVGKDRRRLREKTASNLLGELRQSYVSIALHGDLARHLTEQIWGEASDGDGGGGHA